MCAVGDRVVVPFRESEIRFEKEKQILKHSYLEAVSVDSHSVVEGTFGVINLKSDISHSPKWIVNKLLNDCEEKFSTHSHFLPHNSTHLRDIHRIFAELNDSPPLRQMDIDNS